MITWFLFLCDIGKVESRLVDASNSLGSTIWNTCVSMSEEGSSLSR